MDKVFKINFKRNREIVLLLVIIILGAFTFIIIPEFLQFKNLSNILASGSIYGIMAVGMTMIIAIGQIDLSIGSQFAVIGMLVANLANFTDKIGIISPIVVFIVSILVGMILGFINGYLVAKMKLPAIIVTLGTMSIMRGVLLLITEGDWVSTMPKWFTKIASVKFCGVYIPTYIWFVVAIGIYLFIKYTKLGRNVLAIGDNLIGAKRIGINEEIVYKFVFILSGALVGIGSTIYVAQLGTAQPIAGIGYETTLIAAAAIGRNDFSGGKASILGTCLGVILLTMINNILVLACIPVYWQSFVTGIIIISAILFSRKQI